MYFYHKLTPPDNNDFIVDMTRKIYIFVILLRKKNRQADGAGGELICLSFYFLSTGIMLMRQY